MYQNIIASKLYFHLIYRLSPVSCEHVTSHVSSNGDMLRFSEVINVQMN
jgi:hypothetical protein